MLRRQIDIKKVLAPSDSVAIAVILIGLLIAIFLDEIAIRLIGVCVAVLGSVALMMLISQRLRDIVDTRFTPSQPIPQYKVKIIKDGGAKRQVFEDYEKLSVEGDGGAITDEDDSSPQKTQDDIRIISKKPESKSQKPKEYETAPGEGFKVIDKRQRGENEPPAVPKTEVKFAQVAEIKPTIDLPDSYEFEDDSSGIRIVGRIKASQDAQVVKPFKLDDEEPVAKVEIPIVQTEPEVKPEFTKETLFGEDTKAPETESVELEFDEEESAPVQRKELVIEIKKPAESEIEKELPLVAKQESQQASAPAIEPPAKPKENFTAKKIDVPLSAIIETEQVPGQEPRKEFEFFLNRVLKIIRSITNTRTAAFLLVNLEKQELILQAFETDVPEAITSKHKLPIRNDVVSQIVTNLKPEILSEINPAAETDLIPYYSRSVGTGSFVGVPVFYNKTVIGILCADSTSPDAYDAFIVGFLGQFTKLIGTLVNTYTEKYELQQASRTLAAISTFRHFASDRGQSLDDIYTSIVEASGKIFDFTTLGVCGYNQETETWKISAIVSKNDSDNQLIGKEIKLKNTFVGECVASGKTVFLSPFTESGFMYHPKETRHIGGFFASVPLKSLNSTYGALFVVGKSQSNITSYDLKILEMLGEHAGTFIEHYVYMQMLQHSSMVDTGGVLNQGAFYKRLEEEMMQSLDTTTNLTMCLLTVDQSGSFDPSKFPDRANNIYTHVINLFQRYIKSYHPFGKVADNTYGIVLTGVTAGEAHRWAEKIRADVAKSPIEIENKRYYVTVSIGLAQATKQDSIKSLINNTHTVLQMSMEKTNKVTVFE